MLVRTNEPEAAAAARIGAGRALRKRAELIGRLRPCFARTETWQQVGKYVSALVSEIMRARPQAAKGQYIKGATLTSTMGPGVPVELGSMLATTAE